MHGVTIRQSLVRSIAATVLLLGAAVLAVNAVAARRAIRDVSSLAIAEALGQVTAEVRGFASPVAEHLRSLEVLGRTGLLDASDPERVRQVVMPILERHPQVTSVMVADDAGREVMLLRTGDRWRLRLTPGEAAGDAAADAGIPPGHARWREWTGDDPAGATVRTEPIDYDPRTRPWWTATAATAPGRIAWTEPYRFFTTRAPGITGATSAIAPDGRRLVFGLDVTLDDLSTFMDRRQATPGTIALLLTQGGGGRPARVLALPRRATGDDDALRRATVLAPLAEVDVRIVADAVAARVASGAVGGDGEFEVDPQRFRSGGEAWWSDGRATIVADTLPLVVAIIVPESDLVGDLPLVRLVIVLVVGVILAGGVARAAWLAGRYSTPIEQLVQQSERISRGDLEEPAAVSTPLLEVTRLAQAHERMRAGLLSLLKLERDLQIARQIQQSTFPETLPELAGYEIAAWSDPADETGGDAYDVIGLERGPDGELVDVAAGPRADGVLLLLADATGHGVGPALSAVQVRGMVRMAARAGRPVDAFMQDLNEQLVDDLPSSRFVTAWAARLDAARHRLISLSAGQAPLLHWCAAEGRVRSLDADTFPLGLARDLEVDGPIALELAPGDAFVVLSDGFYEMAAPDGSMLGQPRIEAIVAATVDRGAAALLDALRTATDDFAAGEPARDDRTAVILRRRSGGRGRGHAGDAPVPHGAQPREPGAGGTVPS